MQEKPKVVVSRGRRTDSAAKEFAFSQADLPAGDSLASFRTSAWSTYQSLSLPVTTDEAWRRTDLRLLPAPDFKLPNEGAHEDMPSVPKICSSPSPAASTADRSRCCPAARKSSSK